MKPTLDTRWRLVIDGNHAYVVRDADGRRIAALTAPEAVALGLMNGARTLTEVEEVLCLLIGKSGPGLLGSLLGRLMPLLASGPIERQAPPALEALAAVDPPDTREGLRALPGPRTLHWWVTSYCPRRCVYCFAQPRFGPQAPDATLPRERLRELFREAAELGAENLLVAGAEPLLRPDLPEVMGDAAHVGILPLLTTKHPISRSLADRLATAGVRHISLSLDTMDPDGSHTIVGSAAWPGQARRSASALRAAGVAFSIQAVASRLSVMTLEGVARLAAEAGAMVMQVVPFEPVARPITSLGNDEMRLTDPAGLDDEIARLQAAFPGIRIEKFEELGSGARAGVQCDIGITKLFFLPDGVVHRCYKLTRDATLCGKDLKHVSVAEAWHDPGFAPVISPPREAYAGSSCHACSRFDSCHADGRCIYTARQDHGRYHAPDRPCGGPFTDPGAPVPVRLLAPSG
ncbi:MAG: radical SAM protein [Vicinamibacteraceae bacterium]